MPLLDADPAAGETAAPVPMLQRPPQGGGNRPGARPDLHHTPLGVVAHHHPARVARQPLRRFRGNARAILQHGLARLLRVGQRLQEQRPHLRLEPPPDRHHAVLVLMDVQRPARMPPRSLARLSLPIHPPPATHDPLHVDE